MNKYTVFMMVVVLTVFVGEAAAVVEEEEEDKADPGRSLAFEFSVGHLLTMQHRIQSAL